MEARVNQDFKVRYIGIEMGLSNNAVTSIYQDKRGFIWIGTYDGLNRYDGYNFFVYRNQPTDTTTLVNNRIVSIYENDAGIWVGTKKGLSVYNFRSGAFESRDLVDNSSGERVKINFNINQIKGDADRLFLATAGKGLLIQKNQHKLFKQLPIKVGSQLIWDYHTQGIDFDREGNLWVFVQGYGLYKLAVQSDELEFVSTVSNNANSIIADRDSRIWLGMDSGLLMYSPKSNTHNFFSRELTGHKVTGLMYLKEEDEIWASTDGSGVFIYDNKTGDFSSLKEGPDELNITSNSVYALYQDNKGEKWIGTLRGGVNVVEKENVQFKTIRKTRGENSLVSNFVLSFCDYIDDKIWIGTDGGGLSLWDRAANSFTNYTYTGDPQSLQSDFVTSILKADDGVWVGTYGGGLSKFDEKTKTFKKYPLYHKGLPTLQQNIWVLFRDSYQRVWAATSDGEGLYRYHPQRDGFEFIDAKVNGILSMAEDLFGNIWVGTFERLIKLDLETYRHEEFEIGYPVRSIVSASNDHMLIGTESGGLLEFNPSKGTFSSFSERQGLPNNSVLNILRGKEEEYWLSTYNGISRFDYRTKIFTNYYDSDGLQSNQFNYNAALKLPGGELLFGGIRGFNIINPAIVRTSTSFPELLITGIKINNEAIEKTGKTAFSLDVLELPYDKSMLTFDFAALEYSLPDKISYAYFLEGWDREWQYVGNSRVANYSKLQDGTYTLHIKSTNSDGVWNTDVISLPIIISPPWYRTALAYFLYLLGLGMIIYAVIRHQRRQARLDYEIWLSKDMAQKEKELNEKKLTFFTNISHEFRSPLTLIINPLKDAIYGKALGNGELEVVYRNSRRLLSLVDQLLLFRKTESEIGELKIVKIDLVSVVKEVFACFVHHAETKNISYRLDVTMEEAFIYADREKIEISLFNLISNALKFTNELDGKVVVRLFSDNGDEVCFTVEDNGRGIEGNELDKVFDLFYQSQNNRNNQKNGFGIGLYLVKQFIQSHSGLVTASAGSLGGTIFEVRLLKGRAHLQQFLLHEDFNERSMFLEELLGEQELSVSKNSPNKEIDIQATLLDEMKSILIVDDNLQIRQYLSGILKDHYKIAEAGSAEEARVHLKSHLPDLIISDVVMQGESGVDLCNYLKDSPSYQHIPVILLTGTNSEEVKLMGIEVGADDYITKPFDKGYLIARVKGILKQQKKLQNHLMDGVTQKVSDFKFSEEDKIFLEQLELLIEEHLNDDSFTIKSLAEEMAMSHSLLYKKIKHLTGKSVNEMIRFIRLRKVATLLITSDMQVNEAAFFTGFNDLKYFRKQFQIMFRMNPSDFQKKYKDAFQEKNYNLNGLMDK
ncbi:signal transduction histidine kinase/ligand-binding sensor domain-containing protein/DNA-binding response OmpR family regulator [Algoriphagus sp. 4150]|uniref:hybrid sensor histidine kinase/response regulator transcription factor n=1 Tax=Algoriphagus sp. 4150 TaxID=2817756 RepID=UPI00285F3D6F|nr:two-component regulator propeller domain-containing protein [Algoriphagus sp. 4150]MDR7129540.1 signal transduction histidine kinase/ligand-binding sensor domain-containing protein/DNA-binding response OmpR family regulator [Algoriphagus sp. 4150]